LAAVRRGPDAAFENLFLWTLANEYETHPDGRYRLDRLGDVAWAKATAQLVKQLDRYRHPITVHPVISSSTRGASPRDLFDAPWRIGEFFGERDELDVLSQQTGQVGEGVTWDDRLQCWVGDAPDVVASLRADRRFRKPVLNTENGYEYLRGHPTEKNKCIIPTKCDVPPGASSARAATSPPASIPITGRARLGAAVARNVEVDCALPWNSRRRAGSSWRIQRARMLPRKRQE
jgi:hypothetical protein